MLADFAVIIAAYAVARLLCEYVFVGEKLQPLRTGIAVVAVAVIVLLLVSVIETAGSLSDLNL
jgi:hypothetical protein